MRPDGRRLVHEGHGSRTAEAPVTVNSGSRPRFRFTGGSVRASFGVTSVTSPAQTHVSVDGGPKRLYAVDRSGLDRYSNDADTGERLVTGRHHPADRENDTDIDTDIDVGRGGTGDIDPDHPGYEYRTSTVDVTAPGARVCNVQDGKVATTTPQRRLPHPVGRRQGFGTPGPHPRLRAGPGDGVQHEDLRPGRCRLRGPQRDPVLRR